MDTYESFDDLRAVHIWQIELALDADRIGPLRQVLSPDENARADRFSFSRDRIRFIAAHAAMRAILARYLNLTPKELGFDAGPRGKPELSSPARASGLRFNLSHSRDVALLALSMNRRIGVDVEFIDRKYAGEEVARRFFSPYEVGELLSLPARDQGTAFFRCWTRKEAYIKAIGEGLSLPLDAFDVAVGPDIPPALLSVKGSPDEHLRWQMYEVPVPKGYTAAVVVEGTGHRVHSIEWQW